MKRPRIALSLILGAMVAFVSIDGVATLERGVAADLPEFSIDPLCPADFPQAGRPFRWFELSEASRWQPARHQISLSHDEDEAEIVALVEQAHELTALVRLLLENFSWTYEAIDSDDGRIANFNYGAADLAADQLAAQGLLLNMLPDIALEWRGVPALNWLNECDIRMDYSLTKMNRVRRQVASEDLSALMAEVRCADYDLATEINEESQGVTASAPLDEECIDPWCIDPWCGEDSEVPAAYETLTVPEWSLPNSWLGDLATSLWDNSQTTRCPLIDQRPRLTITGEEDTLPAWVGCEEYPRRGDAGWYALQRAVEPADAKIAAGPVSAEPAAAETTAAQLSASLADALARAARLLDAASLEMEDLSEQAACEARTRASRTARMPNERRDVPTAEIIYVEI